MTCIHFDPKHRPAKHTPSGKDIENQDYHDLIDKLADKVEDKVIAWRHDMHQNPELPNREFRTAKLIVDHLKSLHFDEVRTKAGVTGVVGLLKGGQPGDKVVIEGHREVEDGQQIKVIHEVTDPGNLLNILVF